MIKGFLSGLGMAATAASVLAGPVRGAEATHDRFAFVAQGMWVAKEFIRKDGAAEQLGGLERLCNDSPTECMRRGDVSMDRMELTRERELQMRQAQGFNAYCTPTLDRQMMADGTVVEEDVWTNPIQRIRKYQTCKADCEDFALAKRSHLLDLGWPSSTVLMTYVIATVDGKPEGHAVLTVRTTAGDFVLYNLTDSFTILDADAASAKFVFISRQSRTDPEIMIPIEATPVPLVGQVGDLAAVTR